MDVTIYTYIMAGVLLITNIILIGLISYSMKKKNDESNREINYRAFYYIGVVWLPIGVIFMMFVNTVIGIAFLGIGASYIAIGLANKDRWIKEK